MTIEERAERLQALRDRFAEAALVGIRVSDHATSFVAKRAYDIADAMLRERRRPLPDLGLGDGRGPPAEKSTSSPELTERGPPAGSY